MFIVWTAWQDVLLVRMGSTLTVDFIHRLPLLAGNDLQCAAETQAMRMTTIIYCSRFSFLSAWPAVRTSILARNFYSFICAMSARDGSARVNLFFSIRQPWRVKAPTHKPLVIKREERRRRRVWSRQRRQRHFPLIHSEFALSDADAKKRAITLKQSNSTKRGRRKRSRNASMRIQRSSTRSDKVKAMHLEMDERMS